ncbi:hypothetical protein [Desulfofalx alkaliphila]|uniref:hypothetical protein n=1 Tax=Desulfofalx alkaliphila TaxID=105483 RepID=UPI0004E0DD21|nr:hypothetical protein [Desulfofalx alkaliphila]
MKHFSSDELRDVLTRVRNKEQVTADELDTLKKYIPMHLDKETADKMAKLMEDIRSGKRPPMSDEERSEMLRNNIDQSLKNVVNSIPQMTDEQFEETCNMCEILRRQMSNR